jgi:hypothetical protein
MNRARMDASISNSNQLTKKSIKKKNQLTKMIISDFIIRAWN